MAAKLRSVFFRALSGRRQRGTQGETGSREGSGQIHVVNIFVQDKLSVTGFNLSHIRERIYPVQAGEAGRKLAAIIRVGK